MYILIVFLLSELLKKGINAFITIDIRYFEAFTILKTYNGIQIFYFYKKNNLFLYPKTKTL